MTAARKSNPQPSKDTSQTYLIVLKRRLEPPRSAGRSCGHRSAFKFHRRGGYDFRPWPPEKGRPHREPVTHPDDWAVYVEIGSRVTVERTTLWQRFMLKGWMPERFEAALARLRDTGVIDVVRSIQRPGSPTSYRR